MAPEFEAMGLESAGENGTHLQNVTLRSTRPDEEHRILSLVHGGKLVEIDMLSGPYQAWHLRES